MTATELLRRLTAAGVMAEARGSILVCKPRRNVTPELSEMIREHKAALLALLTETPAKPTKGDCIRCGEPVVWSGPRQGLVNWLNEPVHLACPLSDVRDVPTNRGDKDERAAGLCAF